MRKPRAGTKTGAIPGQARNDSDVQSVLDALESMVSKGVRENMSKRFGIHSDKPWGVMMADMQKLAKSIDKDHKRAQQLLKTG